MSLLGRVWMPMVPEPGKVRQEDYESQPRLHSQALSPPSYSPQNH